MVTDIDKVLCVKIFYLSISNNENIWIDNIVIYLFLLFDKK